MRFRGGVAVALGLVLGTAGSSFAVPGVLDPRFSNDGKVLVNFGAEPRDEIAHDVLVTGSGKIVLAGSIGRPAASSWALARLRPNGRLDEAFSGNGKVRKKVGEVGEARVIKGLGLGRILVGGSSDGAFAVLAFTEDGRLNPAWGGDGIAVLDITAETDRVLDIRRDGAGWLVAGLAGATSATTGTPVITRFAEDGTPDAAFGVRTAFGFGASPLAVKLTGDGGLIVAGRAADNASFENGYAVARYTAAALPDMTFAGGTTVITHFPDDDFPYGEEFSTPRAIVVQPNERILVGGETFGSGDYSRPTMARYLRDGNLDSTLDGDGRVIGRKTGYYGGFYDLALQANGKIVAGGWDSGEGCCNGLAAYRYLANGARDPGFGNGGMRVVRFPDGRAAKGYAVALSDTRIVLAGASWSTRSRRLAAIPAIALRR
jgi:uncharacterized delta-60 repeat protein